MKGVRSARRVRSLHNEILALVVLQSYPGEWAGAVELAERLKVPGRR